MPYLEPPNLPPDGPGPTAPEWNTYVRGNLTFLGRPPAARVYRSTAQSIADNTDTFISFTAERYDTDNMWDPGIPERLTINTPGVYAIAGTAGFASNATGRRLAGIVLNAATGIGINTAPAVTGATHSLTVTTIYKLAIGDYIRMDVLQNSGAPLNVLSLGNFTPELAASWIGFG